MVEDYQKVFVGSRDFSEGVLVVEDYQRVCVGSRGLSEGVCWW